MAIKTAAEIRRMTDAEIVGRSATPKKRYSTFASSESGQLEDYTRIRQLKKHIARLLTVQRERELAAELVQEEADAE